MLSDLLTRCADVDKRFHDAYLADEDQCLTLLREKAGLSLSDRETITNNAIALIRKCRKKSGNGELFDAFLQEYGLSTDEGITLMRLAEALIRTPDESTAHLLLRDKLADRDWKSHAGESSSPLVNLSTIGMSFSAAWIKKTGGSTAEGLLAKLGDKGLHKGVTAAMGIMSGHFVLGRDIEHALQKSKPYESKGFAFSYDMLGEAAHTLKDAETYRVNYQHAIDVISKSASKFDDLNAAPSISVKLSALHPRYEYSHRETCVPALIKSIKDMALKAKAANIGLTIDAEECDRLEVSLLIAEALIADDELTGWSGLTIVVQAYQRRSIVTLERLLNCAKASDRKIGIRLVKGAYWDMEIKRAQEMGLSSYPVFTRKENTDVSYLACAQFLLGHTDVIYPQFATHNAATASAILHMAGNKRGFEFQRLHGMGDILHSELMEQTGIQSRVYAPVGAYSDLLPYLVRRLLENGANSSFVNQFLDEDVAPELMAKDPITKSLENETTAHPAITAPRDMFSGRRLAAMGIDTSQAYTERRLEDASRKTSFVKAKSILNGAETEGQKLEVRNPANLQDIVGEVYSITPDNLDAALQAAKLSKWKREFSPQARSNCLFKAADMLEADMDALMSLCVREAGKSWIDAVAELREAVDFCRYYGTQALKPEYENRDSLGTIACISPWNFPLAIFLGQVTASLAAGNAVICKPAEQTPLIAYEAVKILHAAGVPKDALHLAIGSGAEIGAALVASKEINGVCFTGSTATAKRIATTLADTNRPLTPLIAETGGLNAMIVDSTALLEQAVSDVVASAFQSAGQRCSACRLVCIQEEIADDFIDMLAGSIEVLNLGDPAQLSTDVGPVIDLAAHKMLTDYAQQARETWKLIGEYTPKNTGLDGYYFNPIAFEIPSINELQEEKFGPILHVVRFKAENIESLIMEINDLGYGLTMGLHTRIDSRVERVSAVAEVGNLYINRNQIGAVVGVQPFGGEGLSGTGPKAGGPLYMKRLSQSPNPIEKLKFDHSAKRSHQKKGNDIGIEDVIERVSAAQRKWKSLDYRAILSSMTEKLESIISETKPFVSADILAANNLMKEIELPGPTGESNTLSFHARGVLVIYSAGNLDLLTHQIIKSIATGNGAIVCGAADLDVELSGLLQLFYDANVPKGLVGFVPKSLEDNILRAGLEIDGVVIDGPERIEIAKQVCLREGAILPILSAHDDIERFIIERTKTIDTTAAGGNASLLAM